MELAYIVNAMFGLSRFKVAEKRLRPERSYRPVSLLIHVSKLTEKIILKKLTDLDDSNSIACDHQFGFRSIHSTIQQLARVVTNATAQFKKK